MSTLAQSTVPPTTPIPAPQKPVSGGGQTRPLIGLRGYQQEGGKRTTWGGK